MTWYSFTEDLNITKNVEEKSLVSPGKCFSQNAAFPHSESKNSNPLQAAVFEKFVAPPLAERGGHYGN